jgi:hypothetical protein
VREVDETASPSYQRNLSSRPSKDIIVSHREAKLIVSVYVAAQMKVLKGLPSNKIRIEVVCRIIAATAQQAQRHLHHDISCLLLLSFYSQQQNPCTCLYLTMHMITLIKALSQILLRESLLRQEVLKEGRGSRFVFRHLTPQVLHRPLRISSIYSSQ